MAGRDLACAKKASQEGRTLVYEDESGFYLLPSLLYTYAPRGETPLLEVPLKWEHLSVIGAITPQGDLFHQVYEHAISKSEVGRFLRHLLRHVGDRSMNVRARPSTVWRSPRTSFSSSSSGARVRYKLSLRDFAEMFLERGFEFTY